MRPGTSDTDRRERSPRKEQPGTGEEANPAPAVGPTDDDPFAELRRRVPHPMRRLFGTYGRRHWRLLVIGQIAGVGARAMELVPPVLLGFAIDVILVGEREFGLPLVPDAWLPATDAGQFALVAALIGASFLLAAACNWVRGWGLNSFAQNVQHEVRVDAYDHIQRLGMTFFDDRQTGELMSVLAGDANNLEQFLNGGMEGISRLLVLVGGVGLAMAALNPQLALVALLPVPLIGWYTLRYVRAVEPRYAASRASLADLYSRLENNLAGINVIKTSRTEAFERERVDSASAEYVTTNWQALRLAITRLPVMRVLAGIGFVAVFVVGGTWVFAGPPPGFSGELTVGAFVTFVLLSQQLVQPMAEFGGLVDQYQKAKVSAARVFGIMSEPVEREGRERRPSEAVRGHVEYDDVVFGYGDRRILDGVSLTVEAGETVAFVGPSGSGKSTAMKLLPRLYDPDAGEVRVDGTATRELSLDALRGAIGYVGQEPYLFNGTIRENVAYGVDDATDAEIREAARRANAHAFVEALPDGYDTQVGQRGGKLSGGQRQRISIARTILKDPPILLLDEATSAVDTETELVIQRSIEELAADRTTVAIAHRLSTIRDADAILAFRDGEIVERGTHDELLAEGGTYATLWNIQAGSADRIPLDELDGVHVEETDD